MTTLARGYIASGQFNGFRTPQHLQNQIIKAYCEVNNLTYVLSRAEYWINGSTKCQLWAALEEGFNHIVFFSLWQLPSNKVDRIQVYQHCMRRGIILHFATERMNTDESKYFWSDLELLIESHQLASVNEQTSSYLDKLKELI